MTQPTNAAEMTAEQIQAEARRRKIKEIMKRRKKQGALLPKQPTRVPGPTRTN